MLPWYCLILRIGLAKCQKGKQQSKMQRRMVHINSGGDEDGNVLVIVIITATFVSEFRGTLGLATNTAFKVLVNLAISEVNEFRKIKTMKFQKLDLALQDDPSENIKTIQEATDML
ncbi:hypothetical protein MKW98_026720 [Papaver atlanticum]|uniref:Uncharacterized protein n=1 Tax=Papaver atlanticum TaxID=357466 RepID=A0AAD4S094_9MAGN|nr:hypothetical protein MKW98_026720 [Papaver atlanticum]